LGTHQADDRGIRAYARRLGVTPAAVRKGIAAGRIPVGPDGRIDAATADAALAQGAVSGPRVSKSLAEARRRKLAASVRLLDDELLAARANTITPDELQAAWLEACRSVVAEVERTFITMGIKRAKSADAFGVLRDQIDALLNRLVTCLPPEPVAAESAVEIDLATLSSVDLATMRADRQAEKMELQRALTRGELLEMDRAFAEIEDRIARARGLFLAVPARTAPLFELGEPEGRRALARDFLHALDELATHGVTAGEYLPAALREASA